MRTVFMGTPRFASAVLEHIALQHEVVGVFTRPDAVRGRGRALVPSPVKETAVAMGAPVVECTGFAANDVLDALVAFEPDVVCVAAFGALLPTRVLELPRYGCLNVHASLLPRWRGAAPIQRALLAGDAQVGVSIMRMEEGLDTGAYCVQRSIAPGALGLEELTEELAHLGGEALLEALDQVEAGSVAWVQQDEALVTYAEKIGKGKLNLSLTDTAEAALRKVCAADASHPCKVQVAGKPISVLGAAVAEEAGLEPGQVTYQAKRLLLGFSGGELQLLHVKPDGKKAMDANAFAAGVQGIKAGTTWQEV